ncbi:MAG: TlyA family RNA methyltransferase [Acidobacteria bacterium]|nr:TlyA family RNA methyltransferase [Acidobacteriota bacterium]
MKLRLDKLLVDRSLAASRERAQALILAGRVLVNEQRLEKSGKPAKPGTLVDDTANLRLLGDDLRYVSRGGLKLEAALATWHIAVTGLACADIGASTGGFTDCMLQNGAASVLAVDTGYGQIHNKLRSDPRVTLLERTNARLLTSGQLVPPASPSVFLSVIPEGNLLHPAATDASPPSAAPQDITFFAMDVSFISATLVLPAVVAALAPAGEHWRGEAVLLVKPQFEAGREHVGKGGIVRDPAAHQLAVHRVEAAVRDLGGQALDLIDSPILGMEGNREFLLHARFG